MAVYWNRHREIVAAPGTLTPPIPVDQLYAPISNNDWLGIRNETTKDVLQSVLKVRKSWKTLRDGQTVWPLDLEAALLEGLQSYVPDDSRETRMLGRFPRRNRFISDYIFGKTGQRRSAKQVGSRLQQLRESCREKKLLHLLSPFRKSTTHTSPSASSYCGSASPVDCTSPRRAIVYILDILPEETHEGISTLSSSEFLDKRSVIHISDHPRRLSSINPTITFLSPSLLAAQSRFSVHSENIVLHTEIAPLVSVVNDAATVPGYLYSTSLLPEYWKVISKSPDPTRFTISHKVIRDDTSQVAFSAMYKFAYPARLASKASFEVRHSPCEANSQQQYSLTSLTHHSPYTLRAASAWNPAESSCGSSPMQGNLSISGDSSPCFPSDLSNYVL